MCPSAFDLVKGQDIEFGIAAGTSQGTLISGPRGNRLWIEINALLTQADATTLGVLSITEQDDSNSVVGIICLAKPFIRIALDTHGPLAFRGFRIGSLQGALGVVQVSFVEGFNTITGPEL